MTTLGIDPPRIGRSATAADAHEDRHSRADRWNSTTPATACGFPQRKFRTLSRTSTKLSDPPGSGLTAETQRKRARAGGRAPPPTNLSRVVTAGLSGLDPLFGRQGEGRRASPDLSSDTGVRAVAAGVPDQGATAMNHGTAHPSGATDVVDTGSVSGVPAGDAAGPDRAAASGPLRRTGHRSRGSQRWPPCGRRPRPGRRTSPWPTPTRAGPEPAHSAEPTQGRAER